MNFQQCTRVLPQGDPVSSSFKPLCKLTQVWALIEKPWLSFRIVKRCESESRSVVSDSLWLPVLYSPWNSPGQNTGVGSLSLLQGIFPTQELNPGLPHCRRILYQLSNKESPRTLQWVACPFSRGPNWGLLHCRQILYQLSCEGSPVFILGWPKI